MYRIVSFNEVVEVAVPSPIKGNAQKYSKKKKPGKGGFRFSFFSPGLDRWDNN
jgi:hypothetical protein